MKFLIASLGAVFTITVLLAGSIAPAMAGISVPAPDCGGKPTQVGTGGDDTFFAVNDNSADVWNMKGGNDLVDDLDGAGQQDTVRMGDGDDTAILRGGSDTICLGDGNDTAHTDDGWQDLIKCGDGDDTVFVDSFDILEECENVTIVNGEF